MNADIYDEHYYRKHLAYTGSVLNRELNSLRFSTMTSVLAVAGVEPRVIVDWGCAHASFVEFCRGSLGTQADSQIFGVDVNPYCIAHAAYYGIPGVLTPPMFEYFHRQADMPEISIMTMWDVLEHLQDPRAFLKTYRPKCLAISLPCLDGFHKAFPGKDIQLWKHYRPLEHLWNFTAVDFEAFLRQCGYEPVLMSHDESRIRYDQALGNWNIMTFGAVRKG